MTKAGYQPGKGRTFTPSTNANWTNEFNDTMHSENLSRNALTEKLIEEALSFRRNEHLFLQTDGLSSDQIALLSSKAGQQMIKNVALLLLGNPGSLGQFNSIPVNTAIDESAANINHSNKAEVTPSDPLIDKTELDNQEPINEVPEQQEQPNEKTEPKLSANEKLRKKMQMLSKVKDEVKPTH